VTGTRVNSATLARAALDGDEAAFALLAQRSRTNIQRLCVRFVGPGEADDAAQEALIRAWQRLHTYEGRSSFESWLAAIARRTCIDLLRRRRRTPEPRAEMSERADVAPAPDAVVIIRDDVERAMVQIVESLPHRQAAVLVLRGSLHLSASETATLLECSPAAVNSALQRARSAVPRATRRESTLHRSRARDRTRAREALVANAAGDALGVMAALSVAS
jgi:RNA polymerase sigma-70 factor (ECF subfamily)